MGCKQPNSELIAPPKLDAALQSLSTSAAEASAIASRAASSSNFGRHWMPGSGANADGADASGDWDVGPLEVRFAAAGVLAWRMAASASCSVFPRPSSPPMLNRGVAVQRIRFLLNIIRFISRSRTLSDPGRTQYILARAIKRGREATRHVHTTHNNSYSTLQSGLWAFLPGVT